MSVSISGANSQDGVHDTLPDAHVVGELAQILNCSPIPTFIIDMQHRITHWNAACAALSGRSSHEMVGRTNAGDGFYSIPHPTLADLVVNAADDIEIACWYAQFQRSALIEGAIEAEHFFPNMGESGTWLYFAAAPLRNGQGRICGAIETLQDVSAKRRAEKMLEDKTQALQSAYDQLEQRVQKRTAELRQQVHFLHQLIDAIPGPVFYKDAQARFLGCNKAYENFIGHKAAELLGNSPEQFVPSGMEAQHIEADRELLSNPGSRIYESRVIYADGQERDVMIHKASFTRADGSVGGVVGVMLDITERKRLEDNLRQAATVFESSAEGVIIARPDNSIIAVNRAFTEITGYDEKDVLGKNPRILQSGHQDKAFYQTMWACLERTGRWRGEIWNRRKNGEVYPEWISVAAVHDKAGRLTNYVATFADITLQKQAEEKIQTLAFSDALTGLPNRRLFLNRLQLAVASSFRNKRYGALFFIDLDGFKNLNDTRGHDKGDLLLKQVSQRLLASVREVDTVARLGGDEFVILLEGVGEHLHDATSHAESVGSKILHVLNEPYQFEGFVCYSTPSIGVTLFGDQHISVDDLLKQADLAMYRAKESGRNALRFFDPEMQSAVSARVALEADLHQGLQQQQFVLYYQPQIDSANRVIGAEALVRWLHPQRGLIGPDEFIPLAEETGLIVPLGNWVLENACQRLSVWQQQPTMAELTLAVNVSTRQCVQPDFCAQVMAIVNQYGIAPERLKLEITESMLLDNMQDFIAKMAVLKAQGVCFSLDDFGTGYSSLSYLKRLPLDQLKIDRSFVSDVLNDSNDAAIARTIVALAHNLGLTVIAEGVETAEQRDFLDKHGCHAFQGFLYSPPTPLAEFEAYVASLRKD